MDLPGVKAIFFDMGGTLRTTTPHDEVERAGRVQRILDILGSQAHARDFSRLLVERSVAYKAWADENLHELSEPELWTRWMLPDFPAEQISPLAVKLNQLWIDSTGTRTMIPGAKEVLLELFRRGYRLALVSNTTSSTEAVRALRDQHIAGCFETIVLSCQFGRKKPDAGMLLEAASQLGLPPHACAYVGNDPYKDVTAARKAGCGLAVLVRKYQARSAAGDTPSPDYSVASLEGLLDLFPPRADHETDEPYPGVQASLSTMWAIRNLPSLADFFSAASRLGFKQIELNHQVHSGMLDSLDFSQCRVSSVHEPCPADISTKILADEDWLISATDESKRLKGVEAIRRSIDLAHQVGASLLVVHSGNVTADVGLERDLKSLDKAGQRFSAEYEEKREQFVHQRAEMAAPRLEAVKKSLLELLEYARPFGICLGLENRYHYMDIPLPDELEELLALASPKQLGFWLDTGHAHALGYLGLVPEQAWLARFQERIVGVHFHDATGTRDHNAPGTGEIDFAAISALLPAGAQRTFEIRPEVSAVQLAAGIRILVEKGCVQAL